ncbi:MAG: ribosomal protein S18-alanine N-acetyltransferase [Eubacteriales bacterium]|nr:ribosomal protein S18-alanine N-acetyltransferase [Eubacteriales bacterium]
MILYRPMTELDCEQVSYLYKECFSQPWSLSAIKEMFTTDGYISLVAENDEKEIIGYVGMKTVFDEADITNVAVLPSMRKQGIAKILLRELMEEAKKKGIISIFLEVRASNIPAITLYEHADFKNCGRRKNYYHEPEEDALLMVWNQEA